MKAIWNHKVIAESNDTVVVEDNHYFPHDSIKEDFFTLSDSKSVCPWKGTASYYNINVDGKENIDGAWFYPEPKEEAKHIQNRVAFWKGVEITE
ncbi:DUF427 domain-containing protein [Winogradskyella sp.]|uniref:DUF427 domain-containing protein n=1 Tax=Winogradskyella sp. TaxID=1883156 RepID=UPI003515E5EC